MTGSGCVATHVKQPCLTIASSALHLSPNRSVLMCYGKVRASFRSKHRYTTFGGKLPPTLRHNTGKPQRIPFNCALAGNIFQSNDEEPRLIQTGPHGADISVCSINFEHMPRSITSWFSETIRSFYGESQSLFLVFNQTFPTSWSESPDFYFGNLDNAGTGSFAVNFTADNRSQASRAPGPQSGAGLA